MSSVESPPLTAARPSILDRINKITASAAMVLFIIMILSTLLQVFARYVIPFPIPWTEELARAFFLNSMLLGIAVALREKEHVVVSFLLDKLGPRPKCFVLAVFDLAIIFFASLWLKGAIAMTKLTWTSFMVTIPWYRVAYLYLIEAIALGLLLAFVISDLLCQVAKLRRMPAC